ALLVSNAGPDAATNVVLSDPTPPGLVFVSASAPCANGFPCSLGALANGAGASITATYSILAPTSELVTNIASAGSDTPDPNPGNNSSMVITRLESAAPVADLGIVKSGPASAMSGDLVSYTMVVTNHGPNAVPDAVLSDPTPTGLQFVGASTPCASGFPCALGALANGASVTISATYRVSPDFTGPVANVASILSGVPDPTPGDNSGTATTLVGGGNEPPTPSVTVPLDARWMLALMTLLLASVGAARAAHRRR
ncbi:MAG TPA: DUF11 domain-containing protein, partial [Dokdonella sp.]